MTYIEQCLYDFKANTAAVEFLQEELKNLMSVHGQNYEIVHSASENDPVVNTVSQSFILQRKIAKILKRIRPVSKLFNGLSGSSDRVQQLKELLILKYFEHESNNYIQREMHISVSTFWRLNRALLAVARKYFGD